jgi:cell division septation protein DedD
VKRLRHLVLKSVITIVGIKCWIILGLVLYWVFLDVNPPMVAFAVDHPLQNPDGIVQEGNPLLVKRSACVSREEDAILSISYMDGMIYSVPDRLVRLPLGCREWVGSVDPPHTLLSGRYKYRAVLHFKNNPLSEPTVTLQPVEFDYQASPTGPDVPPEMAPLLPRHEFLDRR